MDDNLKLPIRIPLAGTAAESLFTRQRDDYSCGPACLTSVARLYGMTEDYEFYRREAAPDPKVGTPAPRMAELAERLLTSYAKTGLDTYAGGVAIANIIQGEDHYVVFLKKDGDRVIYYDPYEHEFVLDRLDNIDWTSEKGDHDRWCIDFAALADNSIERWVALAAPAPLPHPAPPPRPPQP